MLASATIANAGELAGATDRARRGVGRRRHGPVARQREIVLWNPELARRGARGCARARSATRRGCSRARRPRAADDLLHEEPQGGRARPPLRERPPRRRRPPRRLAPYRAGYTPEQRREIERRLVEGELLGVTATDALELGHRHRLARLRDLGRAFRARSPRCASSGDGPAVGRAGSQCWSRARTRSTSSSCAEPEALLEPPRRGRADRPVRRRGSSTGTCSSAAYEGPLTPADADDPRARGARAGGRPARARARRPAGYVWRGRDTPAARVSLRSGDTRGVRHRRRGDRDGPRARRSASARSRPFTRAPSTSISASSTASRALDLGARTALVRPVTRRLVHAAAQGDGDDDRRAAAEPRRSRASSSTSAGSRSPSRWSPTSARRSRTAASSTRRRSTCPRRRSRPRASGSRPSAWLLDGHRRDADARSRRSTPPSTRSSRCCRSSRCATAGTSAASRRTSTSRRLARRSSSTRVTRAASGSPSAASTASPSWVADTARLLARCPCRAGCPSCVQSPKCGNLNEMLDKGGGADAARAHVRDEPLCCPRRVHGDTRGAAGPARRRQQ